MTRIDDANPIGQRAWQLGVAKLVAGGEHRDPHTTVLWSSGVWIPVLTPRHPRLRRGQALP
jgi:hypothetical protein